MKGEGGRVLIFEVRAAVGSDPKIGGDAQGHESRGSSTVECTGLRASRAVGGWFGRVE